MLCSTLIVKVYSKPHVTSGELRLRVPLTSQRREPFRKSGGRRGGSGEAEEGEDESE